MSGKLIVIDGVDASGKKTQASRLYERLKEVRPDVYLLDFPVYDEPSSTLVRMYLGGEFGNRPGDVNAYAASAFFACDRYASYKKHWQHAYDSGAVFICNRYVSSNAIHQCAKLPEAEWDAFLGWLFDFEYGRMGVPAPAMTIFLELPLVKVEQLLHSRYGGDESKKDIHEKDTAFLADSYRAALYACGKYDWERVRCTDDNGELLTREQVGQILWQKVSKILNKGASLS